MCAVRSDSSATHEVLCCNFNQDARSVLCFTLFGWSCVSVCFSSHYSVMCSSCISVGTRSGYKIYNCEPFGRCFNEAPGGIGIVEMLFCTSLVALVGAGDKVGCVFRFACTQSRCCDYPAGFFAATSSHLQHQKLKSNMRAQFRHGNIGRALE